LNAPTSPIPKPLAPILGRHQQTMEIIRITKDNIKNWSKFEALLNDGKVKFDSTGRLRYLLGAPVGDLIQTRLDKKGQPIFQEIAEEWFDPENPKAKEFIWT
jgi:hypothetical protein